jgi:hypothetical protein
MNNNLDFIFNIIHCSTLLSMGCECGDGSDTDLGSDEGDGYAAGPGDGAGYGWSSGFGEGICDGAGFGSGKGNGSGKGAGRGDVDCSGIAYSAILDRTMVLAWDMANENE